MKTLKKDEILTLSDNKKYLVSYLTELNSKEYVFLIDINDYNNTMFCECSDDEQLVEVVDEKIIRELLNKFRKN